MKVKNETTYVQEEAVRVSKDMRSLYEGFDKKEVDRVDADSKANIAGKNLKALSVIIADQMRQDGHLSLVHKMGSLEAK